MVELRRMRMVGGFNMLIRNEKSIQKNLGAKEQLLRSRSRWRGSITLDICVIGYEDVTWIHVVQSWVLWPSKRVLVYTVLYWGKDV
jgi:hypothetical protein